MRELLQALAFKWCQDYGDKNHKTWHASSLQYRERFCMWCPNCNDGLGFAKDVARAIRERIS